MHFDARQADASGVNEIASRASPAGCVDNIHAINPFSLRQSEFVRCDGIETYFGEQDSQHATSSRCGLKMGGATALAIMK